jgi:glycosyltransferase involved in cell wall biosynthesis
MILSVIIPTRNRSKILFGTLESIAKQTLNSKLFEVIVVDNGSTDSTRDMVDSFTGQIPTLRYYYEGSPGLHVGRHKGLKEAKSNILVYADDDIEAFPTWLEAIAETFEDKDVVLVGGKNLPKFETAPPDWIMKMWLQVHPEGKALGYLSILDFGDSIKKINPSYVFGCNFFIRKSILLEAKGFHPDAMPQQLIRFRGDGESHVSRYILEQGYKALYHPKASVYHLVPKERMTESYFCKRAYNQGVSDSYTQIRAVHGLSCSAKSPYERLRQMSPNDIVRAISRRVKRVIGRSRKEPFDKIQDKIAQAYRAGWQFHQDEVQNDPKLLEHVLKQTYLE